MPGGLRQYGLFRPFSCARADNGYGWSYFQHHHYRCWHVHYAGRGQDHRLHLPVRIQPATSCKWVDRYGSKRDFLRRYPLDHEADMRKAGRKTVPAIVGAREARSRQRGTAAVEFALIASLLFMLLFGVMEMSRI